MGAQGSQGPPAGLTSAQRAVWRAEQNARGADERLAERSAEEARRLGERQEAEPLGHQGTLEAMQAAFPGSTVVEDLEQIAPDRWVDRRTGGITDGPTRLNA